METETKNRDGKGFLLDLCSSVLSFYTSLHLLLDPNKCCLCHDENLFAAETKKNFIYNVSYKLLKQTVSDR